MSRIRATDKDEGDMRADRIIVRRSSVEPRQDFFKVEEETEFWVKRVIVFLVLQSLREKVRRDDM